MLATVLIAALLSAPNSWDKGGVLPKEKTDTITIVEKLGSEVPLDARLTSFDGKETTLGALVKTGKPTILTLGYYECPMMCDMVLNGVLSGVKGLEYTAGKEFQVVSVSIEPKETADLAQKKRENYLKSYGRGEAAWTFTVAEASESKRIADAVGWQYFYDEGSKQWAHAAGVFVLTPDAKVSRVLYGFDFNPRDLKFALIEASQGHVGSAVDKLILWCFHYDAKERGYVVFAMRVMRVGGALTMLVLALFIYSLVRADRRRQEKQWSH